VSESYLNKNGLIAGLIAANTTCPFLDRCKFKIHSCPGVDGKMKSNNFSCAAARLHSAIAATGDIAFQTKAKNIVEKEQTLFEIRKRPSQVSFDEFNIDKSDKK
jgi:hypothetical protein